MHIDRRLNSRYLQFLDEADLLADNIAILAAPGKLVAQGSPVALKSNLGQGYTVEVRFHHTDDQEKLVQLPPNDLLPAIREFAPHAHFTKNSPFLASYHLMSKDSTVVENVLRLFDQRAGAYFVDSYDIRGTSIEDIFLDLMNKEQGKEVVTDRNDETKLEGPLSEEPLELFGGRKRTPLSQAFTIFHKRALIARRAWLSLLMAVGVGIAGSCIPLFFLDNQPISCVRTYRPLTRIPLFLPALPTDDEIFIAPAATAAALGPLAGNLTISPISDNQEFVSTIQQNYRNIPFGGISLNLSSGQSLIAWETDPPGTSALALLNLVSNVVYNARLNATSPGTTSIIGANYASFPLRSIRGLSTFRWLIFFGAAMVSIVTPVSNLVDEHPVGGVSRFLLALRVTRTEIVGAGHAIVERSRKPSWIMAGSPDVRLFVHGFRCNDHHYNFLNDYKSVQWSRALGMCLLFAERWDGILSILHSGLSWFFTGLPPRCSHTASLCSCRHLWHPSPSPRAIKSSCSWYVCCKMAASPRSRKHGQVYLVGYLVTFTYAQSSKADEIVAKIRKLLVRACGTYSNLFIPHAARLGGFHYLSRC